MTRRAWIVGTATGVVVAAATAIGIVVAVGSGDSSAPRGGPGRSGAGSSIAPLPSLGASNAATPQSHPDASSTGVPAGTALTASGGMTVDKDGTVLDGLDMAGCLVIDAHHVTVRNSRIACATNRGAVVKVSAGNDGVVLENVEIDGLGNTDSCIGSGGFTLRRANVHNCADGIRAGADTLVELSWVHDLARQPGSHDDAIQTITGSNIVLRYNYLQPYRDDTDDTMNAAYIFGGDGVGNIRVYGNLLDGGNITIQGTGTDVQVTDNLFTRRHKYSPLKLKGQFEATNNRYVDGATVEANR